MYGALDSVFFGQKRIQIPGILHNILPEADLEGCAGPPDVPVGSFED